MTNPTITSDPKTTAAPAKRPTARPRPASAKKRSSGFSWKSTLLAASVGLTLFGSTTLTRIEKANAAAVAAQDAQTVAVIQAVQALENAQAIRSAQNAQAVQAAAANPQTRTIVVKVPVSITGGQVASSPAGGQPSSQPMAQAGQMVQNAPAPASAPAIVMPAMPAAPVFRAPVAVTKGS